MNERIGNNKIYLLAKEAGLIEFEQLDWNPALGSPTYESVAKARKFAELLIRECIEVCKSRVGNSDYNTGRMHCVSDLKEHFGVEE